jgi:transcriptional regulator of acetoin/glycerol metabolism
MPQTENEARSSIRPIWSPPAAHVFVVLEADRPDAGGIRCALADVDEVLLGRGDARTAKREGRVLEIAVPDRKVSTRHARILRGARGVEGWSFEDMGSTNGSFVNGRRTIGEPLHDGDFVQIGRTILRIRLALPTPPTTPAIATEAAGDALGLHTLLPALAGEIGVLAGVASSRVSVLLLGETGTGKEVTARAIHAASKRRGQFVAVNCAAMPDSLVEAQLFGHVKGAFSGATREEDGFVRSADGGTLFLDEIGDLPRAAQGVLLRVLQEGEVVPVGSTRPVRVDLRVIAATHQPIEAMINRGDFRRDLFARLQGFTHRLWPLRDRREDVGVLAAEILRANAGAAGAPSQPVQLSGEAARALAAYEWPLNVRELAQVLARGLTLAQGGTIDVEHLPPALLRVGDLPPARPVETPTELSEEDVALRATLLAHLEQCEGNVAAVARVMNKAPMQIYRWMRRLGIDPRSFR